MQSRISETFKQLKKEGKAALIPYMMAGYPDEKTCAAIITGLKASGADMVEIGIPWSDPLADGATIQKASEEALSSGMNTDKALRMIAGIRKKTDIPVVIMTYYNIIRSQGLDAFANKATSAGCDGVIIPDLSVEESGDWIRAARRNGLDTIFLAAPTSSLSRIDKLVSRSTGFIYCVSLTGVTGARQALPSDLEGFLKRVKRSTDKPLAVGFGISTGEQAASLAKTADGVIIGSALLNKIAEAGTSKKQITAALKYIESIKAAMSA